MTAHEFLLEAITGLGDGGLLLAGSVVFLMTLVWSGDFALAWAATIALGACVLLTLTTKLAFMSLQFYGFQLGGLHLFSPSGHVSLSLTLFGSFAIVAADAFHSVSRKLWLAAAGLLSTLIGVTRILRDDHSIEEVLLGLLIGSACFAIFSRQHARAPAAQIRRAHVVAAAASFLLTAMFLNGVHVSPEETLIATASNLASFFK